MVGVSLAHRLQDSVCHIQQIQAAPERLVAATQPAAADSLHRRPTLGRFIQCACVLVNTDPARRAFSPRLIQAARSEASDRRRERWTA